MNFIDAEQETGFCGETPMSMAFYRAHANDDYTIRKKYNKRQM